MAATIAQLRILVQDPAGASQILDDDDYTAVIALEANSYRAAATCCRMIAAFFGKKVEVTAGPVKIKNQDKHKHYMELVDSYDQRAREGGGGEDAGQLGLGGGAPALTGVSNSEIESEREDEDRYDSAFIRGMTDILPGEELD